MIITVETLGDTIEMLLIAGVVGMFGGFIQELLITRKLKDENIPSHRGQGVIELAGKTSDSLYDIGFVASILFGLAAAILSVYLFSPVEIIEGGDGKTGQYGLINVIGLSLLAGVAGPSFLTVVRDRFLALTHAEKLNQKLGNVAAIVGPKESTDSAETTVKSLIQKLGSQPSTLTKSSGSAQVIDELPEALNLLSRFKGQIEDIRSIVGKDK